MELNLLSMCNHTKMGVLFMAAILECPDQHMSILAGSIVRLGRFSSIEWMVAYGWYTWGGNRPVCGWYLMQCDAPSNLKPLQAIDLDDIYIIVKPDPCPSPHPHGVHITQEEKDLYDRAFVTIDSYEDLPNLITEDLHDGKLVRVQHLEDDTAGYYIWNAEHIAWEPIDFDNKFVALDSAQVETEGLGTYMLKCDATLAEDGTYQMHYYWVKD